MNEMQAKFYGNLESVRTFKKLTRQQLQCDFLIIGAFKNIVVRYIVEIRKLFEYLGRDINISPFIIAVNALAAIQYFSYLLLSHVLVFTQISFSSVHNCRINHRLKIYTEALPKLLKYQKACQEKLLC